MGARQRRRARNLNVCGFWVSQSLSLRLSLSLSFFFSIPSPVILTNSVPVSFPVCISLSLRLLGPRLGPSPEACETEEGGQGAGQGAGLAAPPGGVKEPDRGTERSERGGGAGGSGLRARGGDPRGECIRAGSGGAESEEHPLQGW